MSLLFRTPGDEAVRPPGFNVDIVAVFTTHVSSIALIGDEYASERVSLDMATEAGFAIGVESNNASV